MSMNWWQADLDDQRFGNYRIEEKLGQGGMAEVFRAVAVAGDLAGRTVAIKVPRLDAIAPIDLDQYLQLFQREVRLQNAGSTPAHVATMLGAGKVTDRRGIARPFLVMDYYSGGSLGGRLGGRPGQRTQRQSLDEVLEWLIPIARALDHLHGPKGARLHRDVKPENILFDEANAPFLSDFGIATTLDELASTVLPPTPHGVVGSPGYNSPESVRGAKHPASDQFSLAATVYEALSSRLPVDARTQAEYQAALVNWQPIPLRDRCPELPRAACDAIMRALSANPADRFQSCSELGTALADAMRAPKQPPTPPPDHPKPPPAQPKSTRTHRLTWIKVAAGSIVAILVIAVLLGRPWSSTNDVLQPALVDPAPPPSPTPSRVNLTEPDSNGGLVNQSNGLLLDTRTGLIWTQRDNDSDIHWHDANVYCQNKSMRLPSVDELEGIYDRTGSGKTQCASNACKVSPLFRLSGLVYWSGDREGSAEAHAFALVNGSRGLFPVGSNYTSNQRVLCVRHPSSVPESTASSTSAVRTIVDANGGFVNQGEGLLLDTRTGLEWTQSDNGSEINLDNANAYCQNKGMRLPTMDELQGIYDRPGSGTTSCGEHTCKVSPLFRLTSFFLRSGDRDDSLFAFHIDLSDGTWLSTIVSAASDLRALCVRRRFGT